MKRLRELLLKKQAKTQEAKAMLDKAAAEGNRELSAEEQQKVDALLAEVNGLNAEIAREEQVAAALRSMQPANAPALSGARVHENIEDDPRRGFRSYGEFAFAVLQAGLGREPDERLSAIRAASNAPSVYGNENSGADGGFLIPPEFSTALYELALEQDALLPRTDGYPVSGNSMVFPYTDETTPWGTDGVRAYWEGEAQPANETKPKVGGPLSLRLSKLMALVPITDELANDAVSLDRWVGRKSAESIRWKSNLALFQGTGVQQPLGFFGHASNVSVAKEVGQAADTIVVDNITKMYARCLGKQNAIWMVNDDVWPQLSKLNIGNQIVFTSPNEGLKTAPGGLLLGRPVITTQLCKTLGDKGDIVLADWKAYRTITKSGAGIDTATSMHLWFDRGIQAFRATFRLDGQPVLRAPVTPANGANTLSPFVTLDDRA